MKFTIFLNLLVLSCSIYSQELMITDGTLDFKNNSIEKSYNNEFNILMDSKDFSTGSWIELSIKYTNIWDIELNHFYQLLLRKVNPYQLLLIQDSQRQWLHFYNSESVFLNDIIIKNSMNGSGGYALYYQKLLKEKKKRVYELIEYCYMFGVDIKYVFDES